MAKETKKKKKNQNQRQLDDGFEHLSRRESQIMDIVYSLGEATAAEVHQRLPDQPSYSTVRALLRVLTDKGHLQHDYRGPRYVYAPTIPLTKARRSAVNRLLDTLFHGSAEEVVATLLEEAPPDQAELKRLSELINKARREGK